MENEELCLVETARAAEQSSNYAAAFDAWHRVVSIANRPDYLCKLGRAAQKLGSWAEAEKAFSDALNVDRSFSLAMTLFGSLFLVRTDGDILANARKAKEWLEQALAVGQNPMSLSLLGDAQNRLGEKNAAIKAFRQAIELDQSYAEAYYNLGLLLAEGSEKTEAERLLRKATQLNPNFHEAHGRLGILLQELGRYSEGETELRRALEIDPTDTTARLYLHRAGDTQTRNN